MAIVQGGKSPIHKMAASVPGAREFYCLVFGYCSSVCIDRRGRSWRHSVWSTEYWMKPQLLIVTNGFKGTWRAIEYGAWFAEVMGMKITLLGVNEKLHTAQTDDKQPLDDIIARAIEMFQKRGVEYRVQMQNGDAERVITEVANGGNFITVVSPLGRP